ncbi:MAG: hypothetical protein ACTSRI_15915 [Promethearchaeota archaeon]
MKEKKYIQIILIGFILSSIVLNIALISENGTQDFTLKNDNKEIDDLSDTYSPKCANGQKPLSYSAIHRNATIIRRAFESINITVDVSDFLIEGANETYMIISFSNNTDNIYKMTNTSVSHYNYIFTPAYNAPLGFQTVKFLIYNYTSGIPLNDQTTLTNFTIISNCMVGFNSSEYKRGQFLKADLLVNETIEAWNVSIVDEKDRVEDNENNYSITENPYQFTLEIDDWFEQLNKFYYVKVNMTQNNKWAEEYFKFKVVNSNPTIILSTVSFSPTSVFRTKTCSISLNVSDVEDDINPAYVNVTMVLEDPEGYSASYDLINNKDKSFEQAFSIDATKPAGNYKVSITAKDKYGGTDSYLTSLTVKNNPPEILGFEINDFTMNDSISINYGEDLIFTFNVSDLEGISLIKVALVDENGEWFNITREYNENLTITFRTVDLMTGTWYVYIYVIDADGTMVGLGDDYEMAPQEIKIIPDTLSSIFSWVIFFLGIAIGIVIGIIILYKVLKFKLIESQITISKKKTPPPKKPQKKKVSEKTKPIPKKKEITKKEEKEQKPEKEIPKKTVAQRKIKRKL